MPPRSRSARRERPERRPATLSLYVEGARDRDILRIWTLRHEPQLAPLVRSAVILGGRQPHRAAEHFRGVRAAHPDVRGLCVLDRDHAHEGTPEIDEPGLEFFVWARRHIESYLLVPEAILRCVSDRQERFRVERCLRDELPPAGDEAAYRRLDAKRLLGRDGALARARGGPIPASGIARAMRQDELHPDVLALLSCIERAARA